MSSTATKTLLRMALRNLKRNWRHSFAAILSISIGFIAIALFQGYLDEIIDRQMASFSRRAMYGDVLVQKQGASSAEGRQDPVLYALQERDQQQIDAFLGAHQLEVETVARSLVLTGIAAAGSSNAMFLGRGYEVAAGAQLRGPWARDVIAGDPLSAADTDAAVVGRGLGYALDCDVARLRPQLDERGLPLTRSAPLTCRNRQLQLTVTTDSGQLNVVDVALKGVLSAMLKELDDKLIELPLATAQRLMNTRAVSMYSIALAPGVDASRFAEALRAAARSHGLEIEAMPWRQHKSAELLQQGINMLGMYRFFVLAVVTAVAGMSVAITMVKSVADRTREIGTLRSLGYRRRHVLMLFQAEALWLAAVAVGGGALASGLLTLGINAAGLQYRAGIFADPIPLRISMAPGAYLQGGIFLLGVAVVATVRAARRGAGMVIAAALAD